ncbi:gustatory receptor for sugar taste 64e-like [Leptidea sinapis]|uniref:gustatory receptor for sugar taste 64e-like n=1 Tax=Leptidea sinapis TaxID=189913 RepID=UPI0021C3F7B3|nr:gustatory receptor for sugar taste 64e-like [Leptidea sinapis]
MKIHVQPNGKTNKNCEMHACLRRTLQIAKLAGAFSVEGLDSPDIADLKYILEHLLSILFNLSSIMSNMGEQDLTLEVIKQYAFVYMAHVFNLISFSYWKEIIYELVNLQATFIWNFTDVILICFSVHINSYFVDLNQTITSQVAEGSINWPQIRVYYTHLVKLVDEVNFQLGPLIFLSFFSNLFFLCQQMFHATNNKYDKIHSVYYVFSFCFLLLRCLLTSLLAVRVNTEAKKPHQALLNVSADEYNLDVQRFQRQIQYLPVAISGVFFKVTKAMILQVIATIITYEIVLLQFSR